MMMLTHRQIAKEELKAVRKLAFEIWPQAFAEILSPEQLEYMLEMMYDMDLLDKQWENGHIFLIAEEEVKPIGFVAFEHNFGGLPIAKIHKLYLLSQEQGKGYGKMLMGAVADRALQNNERVLSLNVNRFNKASQFYEKLGFRIVGEENIDIGQGFLMEDYVMEKQL